VIPGEGQEDTRARAAMPTESGQIKIIEQFASPRTRLLVTGLNRAKRPTVEVAHEALIRTWPRLRTWIDANREKLRSRVAVLQAKTEWEENSRRDDMLLPAGLQLERARGLLADPGDITTDDIRDFISLSFAREEAERKQREDALARDEARVAQIKASQERTARLQRNTRWAFAAVAAVILIASAIIGYIQWDKAQQLSADQARNAALRDSLNKRQLDLDHAEANFLGQLSETKLSRGEISSALRLASRGTRVDLALPSDAVKASTAAAALAAAVWQASWRLVV
jgi:hypothetical protein